MLVVIQVVLPVAGNVEVFPSVVVIVAHADSLSPARGRQTRPRGYIAEGSVVIVAVKLVAGALSGGKAFESGSIHEEDVGPAVVVIIKDGDARAGGLDDVFLGLQTPEHVGHGQAGLFGHVGKVSCRLG